MPTLPLEIVEPLIKHGFHKDDPFLWVLCKVNRRWRRYAHELLYKKSSSTIQTLSHRYQFRNWIENPPKLKSLYGTICECQKKDKGAGKIILSNIKKHSEAIKKQIFIKRFSSSYDNESSIIHVFSNDKKKIPICLKWSAGKYYDNYIQNREGDEDDALYNPSFKLLINGEEMQTDHSYPEGYLGCVGLKYKELIECFPYLTPTEAFFVIYHAISSDTRAICVVTENFWWSHAEDIRGEVQELIDDRREQLRKKVTKKEDKQTLKEEIKGLSSYLEELEKQLPIKEEEEDSSNESKSSDESEDEVDDSSDKENDSSSDESH